MCELIRNQYSESELPYHIIVPSLPGYTLSSGPPLDKDFTLRDTAEIMSQLMQTLEFDRYIVQGGDVGSFVGRIMAERFDSVVGLHSNMFFSTLPPDPEKLNDLKKKAWSWSSEWFQLGRAYLQEHGTRPSTIGNVLSANPLALMAWIGEKFVEWSDETLSLDDLLTNILLYWFTDSFPRSIYPYRDIVGGGITFEYLKKPTGLSFFPLELSPGIKYLIEADRNVVAYKQHEKGGHFAALEQPQELWEDVQEYVAKEKIYPDRNSGTTSLFSLKQQRIVAETKGAAVYIDAKTGRPVDIRTLGGGWPKVYEAFTKKSEAANKLKEQWESEMFK